MKYPKGTENYRSDIFNIIDNNSWKLINNINCSNNQRRKDIFLSCNRYNC